MSGVALAAPPDQATLSAAHDEGLVSVEAMLMGGRVSVFLRSAPHARRRASGDARLTIARIGRWADRLTRHSTTSELSRLNLDPAAEVRIGPTLAAVLHAAQEAASETHGIVDPTLLGARLAAEHGDLRAAEANRPSPSVGAARWSVAAPSARRSRAVVSRPPGVHFDLDGIAKGWIADRAAGILADYSAVLVDADGDLAIALAYGEVWRIAVADPRRSADRLAVLELTGLDPTGRQRYGLATSGTSVHRWQRHGLVTHHLIDPQTGRPAETDVLQATVLADTAARAEAAAKAVVILGSERGAASLDRPGIRAGIVLTTDGRVLATPSTERWLA